MEEEPPTLKIKSGALLKRLKASLEWNQRGEILTPEGKPNSGSNITDLLHTAIRVHRADSLVWDEEVLKVKWESL